MTVILLITVGDPQLHVAGRIATTVKATNVLVIQGNKKFKKRGGGFHNHVNVPRKLISSTDYAAAPSHTLQLPLPPVVLPHSWTTFQTETASTSASTHTDSYCLTVYVMTENLIWTVMRTDFHIMMLQTCL